MLATKIHPHTEDGNAFSPVAEDLHPHGENPDVPPPETIEGLSEELDRLGTKLYDAALVLRRVSGHFEGSDHEDEYGTLWVAAKLSGRSYHRLQEAADALQRENTGGIGWRMHEVSLPVENADALLTDWMVGYPSDKAQELAGSIHAAAWTLDYVAKRLHFLVDADLPFD
jgi:hypothetical protein